MFSGIAVTNPSFHHSAEEILLHFPIGPEFKFITGITSLNDDGIEAWHQFSGSESFYRAHFPGNPVTPGVILTEAMAQTALVAFGMYLIQREGGGIKPQFGFTSAEVKFVKPVLPGERVTVKAEKIFFRMGKLKCHVVMENGAGEKAAEGTLAGMIISRTPTDNIL